MIDKPKSSKKSIRIKPLDINYASDRYIPVDISNTRIYKIAKNKEYWKRFKIGFRIFTKTFNPGMDYLVVEIKKMTQSEYNIVKDDLNWKF